MTEEEIKKAIEKRRLPLNFWNKIFIVFNVIIIVAFPKVFAKVLLLTYEKQGLSGMLPPLILIPGVLILLMWTELWQKKKLIPYLNESSISKKKAILETLLVKPYVKSIKAKDNYYKVTIRKKWYSYSYDTIILYDQHGYYINSLKRFGTNSRFSDGKIKQIIEKIKRLQTDLKFGY